MDSYGNLGASDTIPTTHVDNYSFATKHNYSSYEACPTKGCHYLVCEMCEKLLEEEHDFDEETHYCACGFADEKYFCTVSSVKVEMEAKTETKKVFLFFTKKITTYQYTITVETFGDIPVQSVEYATGADLKYQDASKPFILSEKSDYLYIKVKDGNGTVTNWYWNKNNIDFQNAESAK